MLLNYSNSFYLDIIFIVTIFINILLLIITYILYSKYKHKVAMFKENQEKFNKYTNFTGDSIIIFDESGKVVDINENTNNKLGYNNKEMINMNISEIDSYLFSDSNMTKIFDQLKQEEFIYFDSERVSRDGQIIPVEIRLCFYNKASIKKNKKYIMCVAKDISEQKRVHKEIYNLSYYDQLTKLPNRKYMYKYIESFIGLYNNTSCVLLIIDINNFKNYNDIYGHDYGDKVLIELSKRLSSTIDSYSILSRTSADEFMIFKRNLNQTKDIYIFASKIIDSVQKPFIVDENKENISISIGIATLESNDRNIKELFKKADFALHNAKQSGRNIFRFYDERLSKRLEDRYNLINNMEKAIENNNFEMYYQPIVDISTRKYVYLEALIRWIDDKKGFISPEQFIPIAEETKLIIPIGRWVLNNVLSQVKKWEKLGLNNFKVCINVSAVQLSHKSFYNDVIEAFQKHNVPFQRVIFEITETEYIEVEENVKDVMDKIKKTGISFSLDDFGTGYASLNYLKKMPISHLKIDKSFINDINNDSFNKSLFDAILYLARNVNIDVVAEGVEKKYQLNYLINHQCHLAQGYYLQVPLPVSKITEMLIDNISLY